MRRSLGISLFCLFAFLLSASFASANSVELLTFYHLQDLQQVGNFYNGGVSNASVPNYGITFSSNFYGLISASQGGVGNFAPDPTFTPVIFILGSVSQTATGTMNVTNGFASGINFFYTAAFQETAKVWSGLNGTGSLLATINLTPNDSGCTTFAYCNWTDVGAAFSGTAKSVTFTGLADGVGIADITLGQRASLVPEPSTFYLLGTGIACFCAQGIRRLVKR